MRVFAALTPALEREADERFAAFRLDFFAAGRRDAVDRFFVLRLALVFFEDFFFEDFFAPPFLAGLRRFVARLADDFFADDFLLALRDRPFFDFEERFFDAAIKYSPSQSSV